MNYLKEFVILCVCLFLGAITRKIINYPIPEPVYGNALSFYSPKF